MLGLRSLLVVVLLSTQWALVTAGMRNAPCFEACQMSLRPIKFTDKDGGIPRIKNCRSLMAIKSLFLCTKLYCTDENRISGLDELNTTCQASLQTPLPPWNIILDDDISSIPRIEKSNYDNASVFGNIAVPSDHLFGLAFNTLDSWSYVFRHHLLYGTAVLAFWVLVVIIGLTARVLSLIRYHIANTRAGWQDLPLEEHGNDAEHDNRRRKGMLRLHTWMQRHVTIPAMFGYRASQPFGWYTVPPRLQSLTIFSFVIMNIFLCAHGYRVFQDNLYFPEVHTQAWRYVSDRTGIISFANFPLIWLFGIRNNLLLWLTGWSFGTYNNFHRWVARVATVQAVVHSIGYTVLVFDSGGWPLFIDYWKQFWWTTGELATISMCALIPLSIYYMRRNVYELFLLIHIALSITILATMWGHVSIFKGHYEGLVWVCCAIWMLDRISRVIRTLAFNRLFWTTRARATYDSSANIVRLSIPYRNSLYRPKPGTFYYLQLLSDYRFWESHPFTMAGIQSQDDTKAAEAVAQQSILIHETASLLSRPDPSASLSALQVSESCMTFLVRPYDSFTSRLRDAASHSYPHPTYLPILVEGPYGDSQPLHRYQQTIFMVGGSGIVVPLVHLERLCKDNTTTRSIHITWAAREPAFIESCLQQDFGNFQDAFDSGKLFMDIFITGLYDSSKWQGLPKAIQLFQGRPTVKGQIQDFLEDYGSRATTAVVSCGPSSMNDDVRKAVTDILGDERYSIEFFQESFNW